MIARDPHNDPAIRELRAIGCCCETRPWWRWWITWAVAIVIGVGLSIRW